MKTIKIFTVAAALLLVGISSAPAQMMGSAGVSNDDHTAREEAEGKVVWEKLQSKEVTCADLTEEDFGALGEYVMGQMLGDAHPAMNEMMIRMIGEEGEEEMHVVMGKRFSGCDANAAYPMGGMGFMSMMSAPWSQGDFTGTGGWDGPMGMLGQRSSARNNSLHQMMGPFGYGAYGGGFLGSVGALLMLAFWILVTLALVGAVKWLFRAGASGASKGPLEILKERYAKGEIDKKEFEEKKKELGY